MMIFGNRRKSDDEDQNQNLPQAQITQSPRAIHPVTVAQQMQGFETVLGVSSRLEGELTCEGNIRLDGEFRGKLNLKGNVLVGEKGMIHSDVRAQNIAIAGTVYGDVQGKKVQILRTGRVQGDITAVSLSTEEGAIIDGKISMTSVEPEKTPDTAPQEPLDAAGIPDSQESAESEATHD